MSPPEGSSSTGPSPTHPPAPPADPACVIRFRLADIDTVTAYHPTCEYAHNVSPFYRYQNGQLMHLESVPVIRLYGATDRGQRVVAHVHGAFPYLYVRYKGKLDPESVNSFIIRFGRKLNQAIALSFPARTQDGKDRPKRSAQHVGFIVVCKGTPFYGYAVGHEPFLKVYIVQPMFKKRAAELLRSGAVLNTKYDVFEDHIPYLFQFQLDCNLRGCGWVEVGACKFRDLPEPKDTHALLSPGETGSSVGPYAKRIYDQSTVPPSRRYDERPRDSTCALELDMPISSILNRHRIHERALHDTFHEKLHPSQNTGAEKLVNSLQELWEDEARRRKQQGRPPPASAPKGDLAGPPRKHDSFTAEEKNWRNTDELEPKLSERVGEDLAEYRRVLGVLNRHPTFESWAHDFATIQAREAGYTDAAPWKHWMGRIKTAFEQTDAIFSARMERDEQTLDPFGVWAVRGVGLAAWENQPRPADVTTDQAEAQEPVPDEEVSDEDLDMGLIQATQVRLAEAFSATQAARRERTASRASQLGAFAEEDEHETLDPDAHVTQLALAEEDDEQQLVRPEERERLGQIEEEDDEAYWYNFQLDEDNLNEDDLVAAESPQRELTASVEARTPSNPRQVERSPTVDSAPAAAGDRRPSEQPRQTRSASSASASPAPATPSKSPRKRNLFASPEKQLRVSMPLNPMAATPRSLSRYGSMVQMAQLGSPSQQATAEQHPKERELSASPEKEEGDKSLEEQAEDEIARALEDGQAVFDDELQLSPTQVVPRSPSPLDDRQMKRPAPPQLETQAQPTKRAKVVAFREQTRVEEAVRPAVLAKAGLPSSSPSSSLRRPTQHPLSTRAYTLAEPAPTAQDLLMTIKDRVIYKNPFYSRDCDVPRTDFEFGGKRYPIWGESTRWLEQFDSAERPKKKRVFDALDNPPRQPRARKTRVWEWDEKPLSAKQARNWLESEAAGVSSKAREARRATRIEGPTQANGGFKVVGTRGANITREPQHMQILSVELHINTRGSLLPDPAEDEISALFYCLKSETDGIDYNACDASGVRDRHTGVVIVGDESVAKVLGGTEYAVTTVSSEWDLLMWLEQQVQSEWDPECVTGYEVNKSSWGYLVDRARIHHDYDLVDQLSRIPRHRAFSAIDKGGRTMLKFVGRHVLPIWSLLRAADNKLQYYSFEHVVYHILKQRTPHFSHETLTKWYTKGWHWQQADVFKYWFARVQLNIDLLDESDIVSQASESARVFGVDFNSVRTRGSQFKVEAFMLRIAKPESFLLFSPNRAQVGRQAAVEATPLVMEPESDFYKGPLVVLDFTSLYPSVMCAYNLCYSTCLGRVRHTDRSPNLGVLDYDIPPGLLSTIESEVTISPNGFIFAKKSVRKSLLAKMLEELLESRVMVKASMKGQEDDVPLTKLLNARQLALKFIANVTYGYTTATASGRMPMVELADAIVQTGRETLERARDIIHANKRWGAKVVYGDTDSLFIYLPGKTKQDAFRIGREMAEEVTSQNPRPVQLKFEKVYLPSVLLAKKRYVGFKYERESDTHPEFDAKGIETVRRDGIAATQKMQEMSLKLLFRTADLSQVKLYCQRQWKKILSAEVSPQDFIVAKEVRLGSYSDKGLPPPGAALAARMLKDDARAEPEYGDRVPYLLVEAEPGTRQVDRAVSPHEFLRDPRLRLDGQHYITKMIIPPLNRIFTLIGVRLESWLDDMRKSQRTTLPTAPASPAKQKKGGQEQGKAHITQHFTTTRCLHCGGPEGNGALCKACETKPGEVALHLHWQTRATEKRDVALRAICASCSGVQAGEAAAECDSEDCPVLYDRVATRDELVRQQALRNVLDGLRD